MDDEPFPRRGYCGCGAPLAWREKICPECKLFVKIRAEMRKRDMDRRATGK